MRKLGIRAVRPLAGGLAGWREKGFPLETPILVAVEGKSAAG